MINNKSNSKLQRQRRSSRHNIISLIQLFTCSTKCSRQPAHILPNSISCVESAAGNITDTHQRNTVVSDLVQRWTSIHPLLSHSFLRALAWSHPGCAAAHHRGVDTLTPQYTLTGPVETPHRHTQSPHREASGPESNSRPVRCKATL